VHNYIQHEKAKASICWFGLSPVQVNDKQKNRLINGNHRGS